MDRLPQNVVDKIRRGRAVLVVGQDLEAGETDQLLDKGRTLADLLSEPTASEQEKLGVLRQAVPSPAHVEIARMPWSLVLSSALDSRLTRALEAAAPLARRVRRRFVDEPDAPLLLRSPSSLPIVHLSLTQDQSTIDGQLPAATRWPRIRRILAPTVLRSLPNAVGPAQLLVLAGLSAKDALDRASLAAALDELDDEQVVLCTSDGDVSWLTDFLPGATIVRGGLEQLLAAERKEAGDELPRLLTAEDLSISVRTSHSIERRQVVFLADELRETRRFVKFLEDGFPQKEIRPQDIEAAYEKFVRTPRVRCDYDSFHELFCVERGSYTRLLDAVRGRLDRVTGRAVATKRHRGPVILSGFPGSGRTTGLHWLGAQLRAEGWCVLYLEVGNSEVDTTAIEHVVRMVEDRLRSAGALDATVLLADGLPKSNPERLDERLRSAGRKSVVVASENRSFRADDDEDVQLRAQRIPLDYALNGQEIQELQVLLSRVGRDVPPAKLQQWTTTEGFLGVIDRLHANIKGGVRDLLKHELEALLPNLALALARPRGVGKRGVLGEQLAAAFRARGLEVPKTAPLESDPSSIAEARALIRCVFTLASINREAPLELLARRFPAFVRNYADIETLATQSGLLAEVEFDVDGTPALMPINPAVVRILDRDFGSIEDRIAELRRLAFCCNWPQGRGPLSDLTGLSRHMFDALRSIGPRGDFAQAYSAPPHLDALYNVLKDLREERGLLLAQSLQIEAMLLRASVRHADDASKSEPLRQSLDLLQQARDDVEQRPRSANRDQLLGSLLVSYATTLRDLMNVRLRGGSVASGEELGKRALAAAIRSQALQDSWHAFDVACIVYRDLARAAQGKSGARQEFQNAVTQIGMVLDLGPESHDLDDRQRGFRRDREMEYLQLSGQMSIADEQAEEQARGGDIGGLCHLVRLQVIDPANNSVRSLAIAEAGFRRLFRHSDAAVADQRARALLLRLWTSIALRGRTLDDGPQTIHLDRYWWDALEQIAAPDALSSTDRIRPISVFWLATGYIKGNAITNAKPLLKELAVGASGNRARVLEPLIVMPDETGKAKRYQCTVRRNEAGRQLVVFVPEIDLELQVQARHRDAEFLDAKPRDTIEVHVATNMRGVLGLGPRWLANRVSK